MNFSNTHLSYLSARWRKSIAACLMGAFCFGLSGVALAAPALKIGYSDWPGWVAWQVAIEKGWLKQAGVSADFIWFDYSASMDAFAAGKLDAVLITNGDALVLGASGSKSVYVMATDYSNGNDMIVARPNIHSVKDLKGKSVAVENGLVEHLLLLDALKKNGLTEAEVKLVNAKTNEMPRMLASGDVAAVGAWQPVSGQSMKAVPGAHAIYSSANEPGLIYDVMAVHPGIANSRRAEWIKVASVWEHVVKYIADPATQADAVNIMATRVGLSPQAYLPLLRGTHLLTLAEQKKVYEKRNSFDSLYGSSNIADSFNLSKGVYKTAQNVPGYIDASFINAAH